MKSSVRSAPPGPARGDAEEDSLVRAGLFAATVTSSPREQGLVARNLGQFPDEVLVRGIFFVGIAEVISRAKGPTVLADLQRKAGTPPHVVAFRQYPHRDFYKLYYAAARAMHPDVPFPSALRFVARAFFPIFRESLLGKTMGALMGTEPRTLLPLLPKAYNLSVAGNHHEAEVVGEREMVWRARAEGVAWYEETFQGIIEGTAPAGKPASLAVKPVSKTVAGGFADYVFQITW